MDVGGRRPGSEPLIDILAFAVFLFVQWRVTRALLWSARKRFSGGRLRAAVWLIAGFNVLVAAGYVCSLSAFVPRSVPPRAALIAGAITLGYCLVATAVVALDAFFRAAERLLNADTNPARRRALEVAGGALMMTPIAVLGYGALVERTAFRVRELDVPLPCLPPELDGLRLVHLSDIHLSAFLTRAEFARVVDQANELQPHLAFVTGDLISSPGDPLADCIAELARLKAPAGIFGCMGNHERYADAEEHAEKWGARAGIRFLRSRAKRLQFGGAVLNVAGVDYQSLSNKAAYLKSAAGLVVPGACNLLLSHNPDVIPVAARQGWNLTLGGHTHGGQVTVEILHSAINPARFFTPYVYGLFRVGAAAGYVTRGVGTIGIPARIGAPPEIALLRLRKA
jgi:predicted MPP superfamily phosphohydrolase